jgi:hypothetical protein
MRCLLLLALALVLRAQSAHERHVVRVDPKAMTKAASKSPAQKQRGKVKLPRPATVKTVPQAEKMMAKSRSKDRRPRWGIGKSKTHRQP